MNIDSGILLAGGTGSRLAPITNLFNKHLVPVYNKFIIDYPLETLKNIGVKHLTIVLGGAHFSQVVSHIKNGSHLGMQVNYVYQDKPAGIAQAISLCERFTTSNFAVLLGDNIFENPITFQDSTIGCQIVLNKHPELNRFGVASLQNDKIISLEEKPKYLDLNYDNYAITGCYKFDSNFFRYFQDLKPSARGEFEIVDIISMYYQDNQLGYTFNEGLWSDTGTHQSINYVNNYFYNKEK